MTSSGSQIDKPQRGRPKRAELPGVNITQARKALTAISVMAAGHLETITVHFVNFGFTRDNFF